MPYEKVYKFATLSLQIIQLIFVMLLINGTYKLIKMHDIPSIDESRPFVCFPAEQVESDIGV